MNWSYAFAPLGKLSKGQTVDKITISRVYSLYLTQRSTPVKLNTVYVMLIQRKLDCGYNILA